MEKRRWEGRAAMMICVAFFAVVAVLGIRYLLPVLLPFLVSWGLSQLIRPASRAISRRTGIPQKACAVVLFAGLLGCVLLVIYLSTSRLLRDCKIGIRHMTLPLHGHDIHRSVMSRNHKLTPSPSVDLYGRNENPHQRMRIFQHRQIVVLHIHAITSRML